MSENLIPDAMLAPDVAETEESVVNYSEKSLAELVRMFEELVGNEDRMKMNKEAEAIKGAFYKNLIKEKTEAGIISPDPVIPDENQEDAVAEENTAEGHEEPAADNPFDEIEKSFKVAGNKYIHRWGNCNYKVPVYIITACTKEVIENLIVVRSTNKLINRQTHIFCIVACKDIAEVTCRHCKVDLISHIYLACLDHLTIGIEVINYLGSKSADINGVSRGEHISPFLKLRLKVIVGKYTLYLVEYKHGDGIVRHLEGDAPRAGIADVCVYLIHAALGLYLYVVRHGYKAVKLAHERPVGVRYLHFAFGVVLFIFNVVDRKVLHSEAHVVHRGVDLVEGDIPPVLPAAELSTATYLSRWPVPFTLTVLPL